MPSAHPRNPAVQPPNNGPVSLHEQFDESAADSGVNDHLDLVVGSVGEVAQRPARVGQHLTIGVKQQAGQHRQTGRHLLEVRRRVLPPAQVAQRPDGVTLQSQTLRVVGQDPAESRTGKCESGENRGQGPS